MVVPLTETGAPAASLSAASASARRGEILGTLPITWIAMLPTAHFSTVSREQTVGVLERAASLVR